ncbi:MAG TPA: T9SS type A sorting domain-containing protein [Flavobacterium sp.]|uniref:T9SS type A sorting domain-containing protein n=1 Tax=Flavobacterium sp. TaxID=239 RepID=UPI002CE23FE6|nr:T9SS type A sorting domain-containing protein [Flavobacterium sp.]HSD13366.1 T9SS type A sorting domain-containing protein [Flavobacterium sp.]
MKSTTLTIVLLFYPLLLLSQAPAIQWQNRIGGANSNYCYASQQTTDGGFIIGGRSNSDISGDKTENSKGDYDYWVVKTNNLGQVVWDKTIGGASPNTWNQDFFGAIKQTPDGGYIICGGSNSPLSGNKTENAINDPYWDFWIVKTNAIGNIEWQNVIGGSLDEDIISLDLTQDGGYILGGYSDSSISNDKTENCRGFQDYWVVKLDGSGNVLWNKTFGGSGHDKLNSIIETTDGGFLLGGHSDSNISGDKTENSKGNNDYWVIKLDNNGNQQWQKTIGGSGFESLSNVLQSPDGGYFLAGYSDSPISSDKTDFCRGLYDFWVVKTDNTGNIQWQKTIGGNNQDYLISSALCSDASYILTGHSSSAISHEKTEPLIGVFDAWVIKISESGNIIWQKTIGGSLGEALFNVIQTNDGGYFLSGYTVSPISGDITEEPIGLNDYWIVKLAPDNLSINENELNNNLVLYPNPVNNTLNINAKNNIEVQRISIYNTLGQLLTVIPNGLVKTIDVSHLSAGNYILKAVTNKGMLNMKFIKN